MQLLDMTSQYDATLQKYTIQIYDCSQSKYRAYPLSIYKDGETYIKAAQNGKPHGAMPVKFSLSTP